MAPPSPATKGAAHREIDAIAILCLLLCGMLAWTSRTALNPDGVSYLDIAARFQAGDWGAAVQGYWSPLYPLLLAIVGAMTGDQGPAFLVQVHLMNGAIAGACVASLWRIARAHGDPIFARGVFAAFLLASARAPRLDAVTPDLLLLLAVIGVGGELLLHGGRRGLPLGLWLGLAFLAKTSSWPWMLTSVAIVLIASPATRRATLTAGITAVGVALLWVAPMSLKYGEPTLGSAGRLNACWYLDRCDSRTPDTHSGAHERVGAVPLGQESLAFADLTGTPWTYAPWSDPTAWDAGVVSRGRAPLDLSDLAGYWWRQSWAVLSLWTPHLLLGVFLPFGVLLWRPRVVGEGWRTQRLAMAAILLGVVGIGQFIIVHAEPRLIAPFVMLASMGVLWWWRPAGGSSPVRPLAPVWVVVLTWLGLGSALGRGGLHALDLADRAAQDQGRFTALKEAADRDIPGGITGQGIVVIGPAIPVVSDAWLFGATIVGQISPFSADRVRLASEADQRELLQWLGSGPGTIAWLTAVDGNVLMAAIPRPNE